jgi:hypothetical protein
VMNAISSTMVYADPRNDITNHVIHNLNKMYHYTANAPATGKAAGRNAGAAAGAGQPIDN